MRRTLEEVKAAIAALPDHIKDEIIYGVCWNFFGDLDEDEEEYIETKRRPDSPDLTSAVEYLRLELFEARHDVRVKQVIRGGELELAPGHTMAEVIEQAGECLDRSNSHEICGEVLFVGTDDVHYCGTVEFLIGPASPEYIKAI
ncbi:MAG TPA: hypothetical protein VGH33_28470, partial [Isosphaeraceae bacterium]